MINFSCMLTSLLVVTPQKSFGAALEKGLDATRYRVFVTSDFSEAIHHVRQSNCPFAILDAELEEVDLSIQDIGFALRQIKAGIQFVLVARAGQELELGSLAPVATLFKPLNLADLTRLIEANPAQAAPNPVSAAPVGPEYGSPERTLAETSRLLWLKDVSKAAQHLTRLTLESSAQAALITREAELWAYAGQLSREAAQELAQSIQRYWDSASESDLFRFVRLQATEAQHMLYARKLSANMILALVFDAETPFSTIRSQAGKLVKNLSESALNEIQAPIPPSPAPSTPDLGFSFSDEGEEEDLPPISELLGEVPPPIPPKVTPAPKISLPWEQPSAPVLPSTLVAEAPAPQVAPPQPVSPLPQAQGYSRESSPAIRRETLKRPVPAIDETYAVPTAPLEPGELAETRVYGVSDDLVLTRKQEARHAPPSLAETRQQVVAESMTDVARRILLEPVSPSMADLAYTCLLIPRFEHHRLVGDAADRLSEWVPQVCVAYGWRLERLDVRPEYLQWVARVPPSTAPGYLMRIVRQQTSDRFFQEFPRFKVDNPSGDFWAAGSLIAGSPQPPEQKFIRDFIKQTRTRQGLG